MTNSSPASERKRILVTDDNEHIVRLLKVNLEAAGYETRSALEPLEALEVAQSWQPDLITTDINKAPDMNGLEMIEQLKADERTKQIPVVVVSATCQDPEKRQRALEAGACAAMAKPFDPTPFLEAVKEALSQ